MTEENKIPPEEIDSSVENITEIEQNEIINPQPETEKEMEVHHHAHDPAAPHHKKNWKSYFWEFLMLFLAVFCGFLAEYQLEHKIEKERAKKYMYDMVENLKYDTIRYNRNIKNTEALGLRLDSFRAEISKAVNGQVNGKKLYELWIKTQAIYTIVFNRTAITQLKNAGNFRLITNDALSSSISDYYERKLYGCENALEKLKNSSERLNISNARFFYYEPFDSLLRKESTYDGVKNDGNANLTDSILNSGKSFPLLNTNPADLKLLYNDVANKEKDMKLYNSFLRWARISAIALIQDINKEYHFN